MTKTEEVKKKVIEVKKVVNPQFRTLPNGKKQRIL